MISPDIGQRYNSGMVQGSGVLRESARRDEPRGLDGRVRGRDGLPAVACANLAGEG